VVRLVPDRPQVDTIAVAAGDRLHPAAELARAGRVEVPALALRRPRRHRAGERQLELDAAPPGRVDEPVEPVPRARRIARVERAVEARAALGVRARREVAPVDERAHARRAERLDLVQHALARGVVEQLERRLERHDLLARRQRRGRGEQRGGQQREQREDELS
jgi:hypothetical protein